MQRRLGRGVQEGNAEPPERSPAVNSSESTRNAAAREVFEETGIAISPAQLEFLKTVRVEFEQKNIYFSAFRAHLDAAPKIMLDARDHDAYEWIDREEYLGRDLIDRAAHVFKMSGYAG